MEVAATRDNKNYDGGICIDPNIGDQSNPPIPLTWNQLRNRINGFGAHPFALLKIRP